MINGDLKARENSENLVIFMYVTRGGGSEKVMYVLCVSKNGERTRN